MAVDTTPETSLNDAVKRQREENGIDCLSCRLMGSAVFAGLGMYSLVTGMSQLKKREYEILKSGTKIPMVLRQANVFLFSGVLVGLGVYRLYN